MSDWGTESVQTQHVFLLDYYMKYYRAFGDRGGFRARPHPVYLPRLARGILNRVPHGPDPHDLTTVAGVRQHAPERLVLRATQSELAEEL
jgi:hypothetical protein